MSSCWPKTHDVPADRLLKLIGLVVVCAPLWWALGLSLLVYHFTALVAFGLLFIETGYENRRLAVPFVAWLLLGVSVIYGFSLLLNGPSHGALRVVAAANNLSFWIMGPMLIVVLATRFRLSHLSSVLRIFPILGAFNLMILAAALVIMSRGVQELSLPTPLTPFMDVLGGTALVEYSVHVRLITADYFSDANVPRFNLYAPYPTAAGAFFMISIPLLIAWGASQRKLRSPWLWLLVLGHVIGLGMTLARTAIIGLLASVLLVYILQKRNILLWSLLFGAALVAALPILMQSAETVVAAREGSSLSRLALYRDSLARLDNMEWLVGCGIRTYSDKHRMPFGSHSTYISLLYRTGLIGLAAFIVMQSVLLVRWYRLKEYARVTPEYFAVWRALGVIFVSMAIWMFTEDLDVPQLLAFLYFAAIGLLEGFRRELIASSPPAATWDRFVANELPGDLRPGISTPGNPRTGA